MKRRLKKNKMFFFQIFTDHRKLLGHISKPVLVETLDIDIFFSLYDENIGERDNTTSTEKGQMSLAERIFFHTLIHEADIVPRYSNSRE
jgi:hypothetical protein